MSENALSVALNSQQTTNELGKMCLENGFIMNCYLDINNCEMNINDVVDVNKYGLCRICGTVSETSWLCNEFGISPDKIDGYFVRVLDYEKYSISVLILDRNDNNITFDFSDKAYFLRTDESNIAYDYNKGK